jgi:hypothetical protein
MHARAPDRAATRRAAPRRAHRDMRALVEARRQARHWLEISGWDRVLVYTDGALSALSVFTYILSTYQ